MAPSVSSRSCSMNLVSGVEVTNPLLDAFSSGSTIETIDKAAGQVTHSVGNSVTSNIGLRFSE